MKNVEDLINKKSKPTTDEYIFLPFQQKSMPLRRNLFSHKNNLVKAIQFFEILIVSQIFLALIWNKWNKTNL